MDGPEATHAAILGLNPLLHVQEMTNRLELEPFRSFRCPAKDMILRRLVCKSECPGRLLNHPTEPRDSGGWFRY